MEDPDDARVENWVDRQVTCTASHMRSMKENVDAVRKELKALWNYTKFGTPFRRGDRFFFFKNDGMQNQYVLYTCASIEEARTGRARVLLDMNTWRDNGTAAIRSYAISENGRWLAYAVSLSGSDWSTIYVRDVKTGKDLPDQIKWVKFSSISWSHDNTGFYFSRYPEPSLSSTKEDAAGAETTGNRDHAVWYHTISAASTEHHDGGAGRSIRVYRDPAHPKRMFTAKVTHDGAWLLITAGENCDPVNTVYYARIAADSASLTPEHGLDIDHDGNVKVVKLIDNFDAQYSYITNCGDLFYFSTNLNATRNRVVAIDVVKSTSTLQLKEIVPEHDTDVLESTRVMTDKKSGSFALLTLYMSDCRHRLTLKSLENGKDMGTVSLPSLGSIGALRTRRSDTTFYFSFASFLYPGTVFACDLLDLCRAEGAHVTQSVVFDMNVAGFDRDAFETKQVFFKSKDGTRIPMFITSQRSSNDEKKPIARPTLLYGYGGFNISLSPYFSVTRLAFMKVYGGTFVVANLVRRLLFRPLRMECAVCDTSLPSFLHTTNTNSEVAASMAFSGTKRDKS